MPNNQRNSSTKTKINFFYLVRTFPLRTALHYFTGFLSAFATVKIIGHIGGMVAKGDASSLTNNLPETVFRLVGFGLIVFVHIAMEIYLTEVYSSHLRQKLAESYLGSRFSQTQKAQFVLSNYDNDAVRVGTSVAQIFNRCFYSLVSIFLLLWELAKKEETRKIIPWILLTLFILGVVAIILYQFAYYYRLRRTKSIQKENKHFEELKNNIEYIKTVGSEKQEVRRNNKLLKNNLKNVLYLAGSKSLYATLPNYALLEYLPVIFLIVIGKSQGVLWALIYKQLEKLFKSWKKFFEELWAKGGYDTYSSSLRQLNHAFNILEKDVDFSIKSFPKTLPAKNPNITFHNVVFSYPETNKKVLDNFAFTFQHGRKYMIIGPNGVGKSTLFKLIVKLYHPQQGVIKLNNFELEKLDNSALRKKIAYLPNNPSFFNTSLGDNIVYPETYQENIHKEKLEKITKKLGIKEFINKLPNRWETIISEKGQNLSEGQKQLVSLMRAFIRDYEIYLFDEFLSNVSSELKEKIVEFIFHELKGKTIIIISHDGAVSKYVDETYKFTSRGLIKEKIKAT